MSKIFKRLGVINMGLVKTTALVGGMISWMYGYEKLLEIKRSRIIVSEENIELATRIKQEKRDKYIDITEMAKDLQKRENDAKAFKIQVQVIKKNKCDD